MFWGFFAPACSVCAECIYFCVLHYMCCCCSRNNEQGKLRSIQRILKEGHRTHFFLAVLKEILDDNEDSTYPLNWTIDGDFVQETLSSIGHSTVITEESLTFVVNILHQYCVSRRWQYIIALDGEGYLLPWTLDDEYDDERESRLYAAAQRQAKEKHPAPAAGHDADSFEHSYLQSVRQAMSTGRSKADTNNDKGVVPSSSADAAPGQAPFIRRSSFSLFTADQLKQFMSDADGSDSDDDGGDYSSTDDDNAAAPSGGANTATHSGAVHIDIEQKEVKQHHNDDLADAEVPDARTARAQAVARQYAAKVQRNSGHKSRFSVPQTEEQASSALELLHAMVTKVVRNPEPAASAAAEEEKKVVRTLSANQMFRQGAPMSGDLSLSPNSGQPALRQVQSSLDLSAPVVDAAAPDLRFSRKRSFRDHRTGGSLSARHTYWSEKEQKSNSSDVPALAQELEMKVVRVQFDKSVLPVEGPAGHRSHREREGDRSRRRHKSSSRHGANPSRHSSSGKRRHRHRSRRRKEREQNPHVLFAKEIEELKERQEQLRNVEKLEVQRTKSALEAFDRRKNAH